MNQESSASRSINLTIIAVISAISLYDLISLLSTGSGLADWPNATQAGLKVVAIVFGVFAFTTKGQKHTWPILLSVLALNAFAVLSKRLPDWMNF